MDYKKKVRKYLCSLKLLRKDTQTHMNKNAYEIRLDVLGNAMTLVMEEYNRKWGVWDRRDCENKTTDPQPLFPNTKEILDKAEELYKFVENK
jgi:hypothetical protein